MLVPDVLCICTVSLNWIVLNKANSYLHALSGLNVEKIDPDSKVHGANMGPIWGQQDPGGPHVGPMNFAIWGGYWNQL